jgi:hypothetical protein
MISMMMVLLIAGIGMLLAGLATVGLGIELDLSFGNTLIMTGAIVTCTGMIMLGLWAIVRELKNVALRLGPGVATTSRTEAPRRSAAASAAPRDPAPESDGFPFGRGQPDPVSPDDIQAAAAPSAARARNDPRPVPSAAEAAPAVKPRRNLLFSSSTRKERERAEARTTDPLATDPRIAPPPLNSSEAPPPVAFDDTWPPSERAWNADAPSQRRGGRIPSTFTEPDIGATGADRYSPAAPNEEPPPVTVLKSGVVDGMAYSLYSDGSIEAQMPEGMMRFASIDELRAHLDQRP